MKLGTTKMLFRGYRVRNYFIESNGRFYDFARFAKENQDGSIDMEQLEDDECLVAPGVIYKKRN